MDARELTFKIAAETLLQDDDTVTLAITTGDTISIATFDRPGDKDESDGKDTE